MSGGVVIISDPVQSLLKACQDNPLLVEVSGHPESVNRLWRSGNGRVYKSSQATIWDSMAQITIRKEAKRLYGLFNLSVLSGYPIRLDLDFYRDTWHCKTKNKKHLIVRPDVSNLIKVAEDAITRALGLEDSAVVELVVRKVEMRGPIRTVFRLSFLKDYKTDVVA